MSDPVIITLSGSAPAGLVTEEEYLAREAARPPAAMQQNTGTTVVRNEEELIKALGVGGNILVPGITITVNKRLVTSIRGTHLRGNGAGNSRIVMSDISSDDRLFHPQAADCTVSDLTLSGGAWRASIVNMDGYSRNADRNTFLRVNMESCTWGVYLSGGPGTQQSDVLEDFQLLNCRITDFSYGGVYMNWEILRLRIQDFYISGNGAESKWNGIWIGLGVVDSHILNGVIEKVSRIGLEAYYPHGTWGGPTTAFVTKQYPNGPGMSFDNIVVADTGSMGFSFAGCKRGHIGAITARNTYFIGVEFIDEDPTRSDYNVCGPVNVINTQGMAVSIDKIKGGRFSGIMVDGVKPIGVLHYGMQVYKADDVTLDNSTFTNCGPRYIQHNQSTRCYYRNNYFVAQPAETWTDGEGGNFAFYAYAGDVYFNGNTVRGNATNPLRTAHNACIVVTSPSSAPLTGYNPNWDDPDNYRGRQYKPVTPTGVARSASVTEISDWERTKKQYMPAKLP